MIWGMRRLALERMKRSMGVGCRAGRRASELEARPNHNGTIGSRFSRRRAAYKGEPGHEQRTIYWIGCPCRDDRGGSSGTWRPIAACGYIVFVLSASYGVLLDVSRTVGANGW